MTSFKNSFFIALAAIDPNGVMGCKGKLPWHVPDDLAFFRKTTVPHTMVMGYDTYSSMPRRAFELRKSFVFTKKRRPVDPELAISIASIDELAEANPCYVIGGRKVFDLFFEKQRIDEALITHMHDCYEGDVFFDLKAIKNWPSIVILEHEQFTVRKYIRPK